jgi:pyruvate kinase
MAMRRHRNVKIVATLGPASSTYEMIRALFEAGADVFRLNMSHGTHEDIASPPRDHPQGRTRPWPPDRHPGRPAGARSCASASLPAAGEELVEGAAFRMDLTAPGDAPRVNLPHPEIFAALEGRAPRCWSTTARSACGQRLRQGFRRLHGEVGGTISNRKGVNVPDVVLPLAALSEKDRGDLEFACELGVDWLALSFVQRPEDVIEARSLAKGRAAILSKIEKPAAVKAYDAILQVSDGIMVARGDLGVELPVTSVPPIQKRLVRGARRRPSR